MKRSLQIAVGVLLIILGLATGVRCAARLFEYSDSRPYSDFCLLSALAGIGCTLTGVKLCGFNAWNRPPRSIIS